MAHGTPGKRKRGNKPKYVYSTQQEVVAHRRAVTLLSVYTQALSMRQCACACKDETESRCHEVCKLFWRMLAVHGYVGIWSWYNKQVFAPGRCERNRDTALRSYYKRKAEQERLRAEVRGLLVCCMQAIMQVVNGLCE